MLAEMAGVSRMYLNRNKQAIDAYFRTATPATVHDMERFKFKEFEYLLSKVKYSDDGSMFKEQIGAIVGFLMKAQYNLLGHVDDKQTEKIISIGQHVFNLVRKIKSYKKEGWTKVYRKWDYDSQELLRQNEVAFVDKLFQRKDEWSGGNQIKLWKVTPLTDSIVQDAMELFFENFDSFATMTPNFLKVTGKECYTKCPPYRAIRLAFSVTSHLTLHSQLQIINFCIGFDSKAREFIVSLEHEASTNENIGRTYNLFTMLKSCDRKALGYINYDMSCALQSISLQLIKATEREYPILTRYAQDKIFKRYVRETIAKELNVEVCEVKQRLTAFANGGLKDRKKHLLYAQFQEESDRLRREVLSYVAKYETYVLELAIKQSKRELSETIDWRDTAEEKSHALARDKSSVFFFVWTYYERLIRQAMLKVLIDGIGVHDAVYSRHDIDIAVIEETITKETGFNIRIEKEQSTAKQNSLNTRCFTPLELSAGVRI